LKTLVAGGKLDVFQSFLEIFNYAMA